MDKVIGETAQSTDTDESTPPPLLTITDENEISSNEQTRRNTRKHRLYEEVPARSIESRIRSSIYYRPSQKILKPSPIKVDDDFVTPRLYSPEREVFLINDRLGSLQTHHSNGNETKQLNKTTKYARRLSNGSSFTSDHESTFTDDSESRYRTVSHNGEANGSPPALERLVSEYKRRSPKNEDDDTDRRHIFERIDRKVYDSRDYSPKFSPTRSIERSPRETPNQYHISEAFENKALLNFQVLDKTNSYVTLYVEVNGRRFEGRLPINEEADIE